MKESQWRSQLIEMIRSKHKDPSDFIWAMDAKFKAGFPDLYLVLSGVDIPKHYELKVSKTAPKDDYDVINFFKKIQVSIMKSICKAGGHARGLILTENSAEVWMVDFYRDKLHVFGREAFNNWWSRSCHSWEEAES